MDIVFDLQKESTVPLVLQGNGLSPTILQNKVVLKPNTFYLMSTTLSGLPAVRLDLFGDNYDAPEQQLMIPEESKENYKFEGKVNSSLPPSGDTYFRLFFTGNEDVTIHNLSLYDPGIKNTLFYYSSIVLFVISLALLLSSIFRKQPR